MNDLSEGDYLYQSDQELFLVVTGEHEDSYTFAVHGWRKIGKERLEEYIDDNRSKVHDEDNIEEVIDEEANESQKDKFEKLKQLFAVYEDADIPDDGLHEDFALDET